MGKDQRLGDRKEAVKELSLLLEEMGPDAEVEEEDVVEGVTR